VVLLRAEGLFDAKELLRNDASVGSRGEVGGAQACICGCVACCKARKAALPYSGAQGPLPGRLERS
jgi:hypothetical protein